MSSEEGTEVWPLVERERLSGRLRGADTPAILLQAPAGYGKSVLLAQWADSDRRPFATINLSDAHNDPAVLLAALVDAMAPIEPLADAVVSSLRAPQLNLDVAVPRLEATLRERTSGSVLVLDDAEHLRSAGSLRLLEAVMAGVTGPSRLVIATRRTPPIHAVRLQAGHRLTVLDTADLVMTRGEASSLLADAGLRASDEEVEAILAKTEGWPVALYLATLGRRPWAESSLPASGFGGAEHNLVDYMREEFLAVAAPADVDFLVRVSFLDRLGGELCDAVSETVGSGARLADLARQNLLLVPLDRGEEWFRMHSLFADMLRGELRRRHGDLVDELKRRASVWWESAGDPERAIGFAIDGGDFTRAGRLIWEAVPGFNTTARYASVQGWIERIGLTRAADDPHLSLTVAHGFLGAGDGGGAEYWAEIARGLLDSTPRVADDGPAGVAMIDAALARGGVADLAAGARLAADSLDGESPWSSMADLMAGIAAHLAGDGRRARHDLSDAARRAAIWNVPLIQVLALAQLALLDAAEGDWQSARILASQARAQVDRSGLIARPSIVLAIAVSSYVNANEHRREDAFADLEVARGLLGRLREFGAWFELETAACLAAAAVALNDVDTARALLGQARGHLADVPDAPMLDVWIEGIEAGLLALSTSDLAELTPAEMRVLRLLSSHLSYRQIAAELIVSPNTIKTQVRSAFGKLGVSSRHEAVELCGVLNLTAEPEPSPEPDPASVHQGAVAPPIAPSG